MIENAFACVSTLMTTFFLDFFILCPNGQLRAKNSIEDLCFWHQERCKQTLHSVFLPLSLLVLVYTFQLESCLFCVTGTTKCFFSCVPSSQVAICSRSKVDLKVFFSPVFYSPEANRGGCDKEKGSQVADC